MSAIGCLCSLLFKLTLLTIIVLFGLAFIPTIDIDIPKNRYETTTIKTELPQNAFSFLMQGAGNLYLLPTE